MIKTPTLNPNPRRSRWLGNVGFLLAFAGAGAVVVGGALPWAQFSVFGNAVSLPGLLVGVGTATTLIGGGAIACVRRLPAVNVALGIAAVIIGWNAPAVIGQAVVRQMLRVQNSLAPVNEKLAQAALPPIEPFPSVLPARDYVGPGPLWTLWGGLLLTAGAASQLVAKPLARRCPACGTVWAGGRTITFCPRCGAFAASAPICAVCQMPRKPGDTFCAQCGEKFSVSR